MKKSALPRTRNKWLAAVAVMFCLGLLHNVTTFAKENGPCAEDAAKFCKDVKPGQGGIAKCLKEHESELSASCKDSIAAMKEKVQDFSEACKNDASKFCKDTKPGRGRILKCLKQHEGELSAECKQAMPSKK
jgi:hypothetical protein